MSLSASFDLKKLERRPTEIEKVFPPEAAEKALRQFGFESRKTLAASLNRQVDHGCERETSLARATSPLDGLPCSPVVMTASLSEAWQTKSLTPEQIIAEDCAAVGLRCGTDSEIVGFDLDGNTAIDRAIAAGCEP